MVYNLTEYHQKFFKRFSLRTVKRRLYSGNIPSNHKIKRHNGRIFAIEVIDDIRLPKHAPFKRIIDKSE